MSPLHPTQPPPPLPPPRGPTKEGVPGGAIPLGAGPWANPRGPLRTRHAMPWELGAPRGRHAPNHPLVVQGRMGEPPCGGIYIYIYIQYIWRRVIC